MINFNYSKGFALKLNGHNLTFCYKEAVLFQMIHLKCIEIENAILDLNCAIAISKGIKNSRNYLKSFYFQMNRREFSEMKNYILLFKALFYCNCVNSIVLGTRLIGYLSFKQWYSSRLLDSYNFEFLSHCKRLRKFSLKDQMILSNQEFNYFYNSFCLEDLEFQDCHFQGKAFLSFMKCLIMNAKLKYLALSKLEILDNDDSNQDNQLQFKELIYKQNKLKKFEFINDLFEGDHLICYAWNFQDRSLIDATPLCKLWNLSNTSLKLSASNINISELNLKISSEEISYDWIMELAK